MKEQETGLHCQSGGGNRRLFLAGGLSALLVTGTAPMLLCAQPKTEIKPRRRALIVYYSRTGNTRTVAETIAGRMMSAMIRVETKTAYPQDYDAMVQRARQERDSGIWPEIRPSIADLRDYFDVLFLGGPIWGDNLNPPMKRFLADHDLTGKTIAPFVTYMVSGLGQSIRNIRELAPQASLLEGLAIRGENAGQAAEPVDAWLGRIGMR